MPYKRKRSIQRFLKKKKPEKREKFLIIQKHKKNWPEIYCLFDYKIRFAVEKITKKMFGAILKLYVFLFDTE